MSRRAELLVTAALALVAGCEDKTRTAPPDASTARAEVVDASPPVAVAVAVAEPASLDAGAEAGAAGLPSWAFGCDDASSPRAGKSIGHTSVVFKLELSNGKKAAWKPNAKRVKGRYKGEIAAYRLAEALGIPNVPPACLRAFDAAAASSALAANEEARKLLAEEAIVEQGKIYGVVIPWIDGLQFWPLEEEPLRTQSRLWLTAGKEIPPAKAELARQTSTLIAFDFITGNWDRYSGANVGMDRSGSLVLYIDNDAAFMEAPPASRVARNTTLLQATERFSRSFVGRVRALGADQLAAALGDEAPGRPLLSKTAIAIVARRMKELVAVIDRKIAARGEGETLFFP